MEKDKKRDVEKLKKRYQFWGNSSLGVSLICIALFVGSAAKSVHTNNLNNDREDLADRLYKYGANDEYRQMVDNDRRKIYEQLRSGEITLEQFNDGYLRIDSDEYFISWARTLDDENVHAIIDEYDQETAVLNSQMQTESAISAGTLVGGMCSLAMREIFMKKREDLEEENDNSNDCEEM